MARTKTESRKRKVRESGPARRGSVCVPMKGIEEGSRSGLR